MTDKELCRLAVEARGKAYAPYSGYRVGAALLAKSGEVYLGSNIENAAYTPTVCAERTAFFKAVSEGETEFFAIAVAGGYGYKVGGAFPPCGVCRQFMAVFCDGDFKILTVTGDGMFEEYTLTELLP
ncbi:MAG: cytidine deaminase, partial [Clostridia bacterium]|nr:cytidine deaminase [Clostridia bacterium]